MAEKNKEMEKMKEAADEKIRQLEVELMKVSTLFFLNLIQGVTSNCQQTCYPYQLIRFIVSSIVAGVNAHNKIVNKCLCR